MENTNIIMNDTQVKEKVSFDEALRSLGKVTPAQLFAHAYKNGNDKAIPEAILKKVWEDSPIVADKLESYFTNVYFIQYCVSKHWECLNTDKEAAEKWRNDAMDAWGTILTLVGSEYFRYPTDWLYFIVSSMGFGKESKESCTKRPKPVGFSMFRKRIEILIGLTLKGYVYTNPMDTPEEVAEKRINKAKRAAEKEAKRIAAIAKAETKKQATAAPAASEAPAITQPMPSDAITQTAGKPAPAKQPKQQPKKAKQQETQTDSDTLPAFDGLFDDMIIPGETSADISAA